MENTGRTVLLVCGAMILSFAVLDAIDSRTIADGPSEAAIDEINDTFIADVNEILERNREDGGSYNNWASPQRQMSQSEIRNSAPSNAYSESVAAYDQAQRDALARSLPIGARNSVASSYGNDSASRQHIGASSSSPLNMPSPPVNLSRSGPGLYTDGNGDVYVSSGSHGVVNTKTGKFVTVN
ncbi:hypothetical protein [Croceicoccus mobilis]|uniref:Uncharacterized protein n=1 Tax=Croceicoccus mobilis TaxID=1703339 RepID=A0A916YV51_9SPHN|nr:hypothetical protein [Croceicoccus mobilis]GGD61728.1 hypothetical protein GCM10010990_09010 [Croceicoccus mobilis]